MAKFGESVLGAIGGLFGGLFGVTAARAERKQGQAAEQIGEYNAKTLEQEAQASDEKYALAEKDHRTKVRRLLATQRALYAKSGMDLSSGSPLAMLALTTSEGEMDSLLIRHEGVTERNRLLNEANLQRYYGRVGMTMGRFSSQATFLGSLGKTSLQAAKTIKDVWPTSTASMTGAQVATQAGSYGAAAQSMYAYETGGMSLETIATAS